MRAPSAAALLDAWERARTEPSALRAATLLTAALDGESADALASVSIGERDRRLLSLREWTFGSALVSVADCPSCGDRLEWTVRASELRVPTADASASELFVDVDGHHVRFRLPNSHDLAAASGAAELDRAREVLLARCLLSAEIAGQPASLGELESLPAAVRDAISARMAEADLHADDSFNLTCPACGHQWNVLFDIESFFWSELCVWAERILEEVHTLACAYGWRERDILTMGPWRRHRYLELVSV
jgi:hypothetical protein